MISSFISPHIFIPKKFQYMAPCVYKTTSYFVWGNIWFHLLVETYALEDILLPLIIIIKIKVHHLQPYEMNSKHPKSAYRYMYLIIFLLIHPATILLEWRTSFPWPASSICHHVLIPKFCKIEFPMKPFAFLLVSESREDSIRKMSTQVSILIIEWWPLISMTAFHQCCYQWGF